MTACEFKSLNDKQVKLCNDLGNLNSSVKVLKQASNSSTVTTLKQSEKSVTEAFRAVKATANEIQTVNIDNLEAAYEDLGRSVNAIPEQLPMSQAIASVSGKIITLESALTQVQSGLQCK